MSRRPTSSTDRQAGARRARSIPRASIVLLALLAVVLAGCGGGGESSDSGSSADAFETVATETDTTVEAAVEPSTVATSDLPPPGEARVEVDGRVIALDASGSIHYDCEVTDDEVRVNYQQTEAGDLTFQASTRAGDWLGNLTFAAGDDNYGGTLQGAEGLALSPGAVVYSGTLTHRTYSDPANTRDVDATIAVNCGTAGADGGAGEATAEIGGRSLTFPASGAQSFDCEVSATSIAVRINRLAVDGTQIEVQGTEQDGEWLGNVYVISGSDRYKATLPADGTGLDIVGTTVSFTGTFDQSSEADPATTQQVSGSAEVSCP